LHSSNGIRTADVSLDCKQHPCPSETKEQVVSTASVTTTTGVLDFASDLRKPDFAQIAQDAECLGLTVDTPEQLKSAIVQALSYDGPALVEVRVAKQELSMPPTITFEEAKGFGLFLLKAVLNGRGDEVLDLARVNLLR